MKLSINGIPPNELLFRLDEAVRKIMEESSVPMNVGTLDNKYYYMDSANNWLWACGRLSSSGQLDYSCEVPCWLRVGGNFEGVPVLVSGDSATVGSERLQFSHNFSLGGIYKGDLNYKQVHTEIARLFTGHDSELAEDILLTMMGIPPAHYPGTDTNERKFICSLTALMFGVESSRFKSAMATNLFLLDLIQRKECYGRSNTKRFGFSTAFHREDVFWDSRTSYGTPEWYGGKYPYAVHGTGRGNKLMRDTMAVPGYSPHIYDTLSLSQRHEVPRREVTLLIHWLEAKLSDMQISNLSPEGVFAIILERLRIAYINEQIPGPFPFSPRRFTAFKEVYVPGFDVYWLTDGIFYHKDLFCTSIPGRYRNPHLFVEEHVNLFQTWYNSPTGMYALQTGNYERINVMYKWAEESYSTAIEKVRGKLVRGPKENAEYYGKKPCLKCCKKYLI